MLTRVLTIAVISMAFSAALNAQVPATTTEQNQTDKVQGISPEKQALIKELLETTNSKKLTGDLLNSMVEVTQKDMPEIIWQSLSDLKSITELTPAEQQHLRDEITDSVVR